MASVEIRGVKKAYGATQVIHGVDIEINDGEFVRDGDSCPPLILI
jgi:multiple sugar transport system ATP-binding protein